MAKSRIRRQVMINGKLQWITGATEQDYANNLIKALQGITPAYAAPARHDFGEYAWKCYEIYMKPNLSTVSQHTYERQLRLHICPVFVGKSVEEITPADVMQVFNGMDKHGQKVAKTTKDKAKTVLNQILEAAVEEGLLQKNPLKSRSVKIKGKPSMPTEPYSVEQMTLLIKHLPMIAKAYDRNYLALQALHPLRPEEVLGLKWRDIDLERNEIHIRNTVTHPDRNQPEFKELTKTEKSRRTLDLVEGVKPYLTTGKPDEFVVGGEQSVSYQQVQRMCERIRRDTGFGENITPQRFRTTVLTDIYDQNRDVKEVQEAAGHTTAAMTLKYYVKGRVRSGSAGKAVAAAYGLKT